jgi:hypothetical protein
MAPPDTRSLDLPRVDIRSWLSQIRSLEDQESLVTLVLKTAVGCF